jgi:hypothetical protein
VKERKKSYVEPLVVLIPRYRQLISRSAAEYQDLPQEDKFKKEFKIAVLLAHETAHALSTLREGGVALSLRASLRISWQRLGNLRKGICPA